MSNMDQAITTEIYIGGESRPASDGSVYDIHNPARPSELVGHAASATVQDVEDAVEAGYGAFPSWAAMGFPARAKILRKIADKLGEDEEDIKYRSRLFTREHGKIARETLMEMTRLGDRFRQAADYGDRIAIEKEIKGPPVEFCEELTHFSEPP